MLPTSGWSLSENGILNAAEYKSCRDDCDKESCLDRGAQGSNRRYQAIADLKQSRFWQSTQLSEEGVPTCQLYSQAAQEIRGCSTSTPRAPVSRTAA
jgi:hypothetical protein